MTAMVTKQCGYCTQSHTVRRSDLDRGWGLFCSKTCKAKHQEQRTGQHVRNSKLAHPATRSDGLRRAIDRKRIFTVMEDDTGQQYIDPEDDGFPENDF